MNENAHERNECKIRLKCLDDRAKVRIERFGSDSSSEIDCRVNTYQSCNFNPFNYRNANFAKRSISNNRLPNLNKFMDSFLFRWYDQDGVHIRNYNRPTHFMIRQKQTNLSSIILSNRLILQRPFGYTNLTCTAQIEPGESIDSQFNWLDVINSTINSASSSFAKLIEEQYSYIRFEPNSPKDQLDLIECPIELNVSSSLMFSFNWLILITILLALVAFSIFSQIRKS